MLLPLFPILCHVLLSIPEEDIKVVPPSPLCRGPVSRFQGRNFVFCGPLDGLAADMSSPVPYKLGSLLSHVNFLDIITKFRISFYPSLNRQLVTLEAQRALILIRAYIYPWVNEFHDTHAREKGTSFPVSRAN